MPKRKPEHAAARSKAQQAGAPRPRWMKDAVEGSGMSGEISPDMPLPSTASFIQRGLGAPACCAFDLAAACSGFLFGMTVAEQFIKTGKARYVLIVGAELLSRYIDYQDRATCVIFGDGVAAA